MNSNSATETVLLPRKKDRVAKVTHCYSCSSEGLVKLKTIEGKYIGGCKGSFFEGGSFQQGRAKSSTPFGRRSFHAFPHVIFLHKITRNTLGGRCKKNKEKSRILSAFTTHFDHKARLRWGNCEDLAVLNSDFYAFKVIYMEKVGLKT